MKKSTYLFEGKLIANQPITVSIPGKDNLPRNGSAISGAKPYFPATSIRGAFRHSALLLALSMAKKSTGEDKPFNVDNHFMLAQGVDTGGVIKDKAGQVDANKVIREKNPLLSLFGHWRMGGKVDVGNAFPSKNNSWTTFGAGARGVMFERNEALVDELIEDEQERLKAILTSQSQGSSDAGVVKKEITALRKEARAHKESGNKELMNASYEEIKKLEESIAEIKDAKVGGKESIRRPLDGYEAFCAGSELEHKMILKGVTDIELGFFMLSLAQFAKSPMLGGHHANGCGEVEFEWTISTWLEDDFLAPTEVGSLKIGFKGVSIEGDCLENALTAVKNASFDFTMVTE